MITIKNYKVLEGYAMDTKDFRIGEIQELERYYLFWVVENGIPYWIRLHRYGPFEERVKAYHWIVLMDGSNTTQYHVDSIKVEDIRNPEKFIKSLNSLIIKGKPKAQPVTGRNFNNPF